MTLHAVVSSAVPDPVTSATQLANNTGPQLLNSIIAILPVLVPFFVVSWAIGFVWHKFFGKKKATPSV